MFSKTITLVASTNTEVDFGTEIFEGFTIYNFGSVDVYANVDAAAVLEGDGSVIIPAESFRTFNHRGKTPNVISSGTPKIEVTGVKL